MVRTSCRRRDDVDINRSFFTASGSSCSACGLTCRAQPPHASPVPSAYGRVGGEQRLGSFSWTASAVRAPHHTSLHGSPRSPGHVHRAHRGSELSCGPRMSRNRRARSVSTSTWHLAAPAHWAPVHHLVLSTHNNNIIIFWSSRNGLMTRFGIWSTLNSPLQPFPSLGYALLQPLSPPPLPFPSLRPHGEQGLMVRGVGSHAAAPNTLAPPRQALADPPPPTHPHNSPPRAPAPPESQLVGSSSRDWVWSRGA